LTIFDDVANLTKKMHPYVSYILIALHYPIPSTIFFIIALVSIYHPVIIARYLATDDKVWYQTLDICDDAVSIIFSYLPNVDKYLVSKKMYMAAFNDMDRIRLNAAFDKASGRGLFPLVYKEYIMTTGYRLDNTNPCNYGGRDTFMYFFRKGQAACLNYVPDDLTIDDYKYILSRCNIDSITADVYRMLLMKVGYDVSFNYRSSVLIADTYKKYPEVREMLRVIEDDGVMSHTVHGRYLDFIDTEYDVNKIYDTDVIAAIRDTQTLHGAREGAILLYNFMKDEVEKKHQDLIDEMANITSDVYRLREDIEKNQ